jgi:4-phospho-D-threonate 3-dehydrogenase / 4-phospho-D-erythronate 3-dehydrogenase
MEAGSRVIGLTMGDAAGVGPEVICKSLAAMDAARRRSVRIYGNLDSLRQAAGVTGVSLAFADVADANDAAVAVRHLDIQGATVVPGRLDPRAGDAAFRFIRAAVTDALAGEIGCIVTAPINKEAGSWRR